jgi:hypothetical protein
MNSGRKVRIRRPGPAMTVACAALFFSLTGWGVAAKVALAPDSVGTRQIVNGSVRLADLHPTAVLQLKGQRGDQGPAGSQGPAGGFNPAKITYQTASTTSVAPNALGVSAIECPTGSVPVGGGGLSSRGRLTASVRVGNGWVINVLNDTQTTLNISALAVCASA